MAVETLYDSMESKVHHTSWKKMLKNKDSGRLGLRDLRVMNIACLLKFVARLVKNEDSLSANIILKLKYNRGGDLLIHGGCG